MKTITNKLKLAFIAVGLLAIGTTYAQTTTGDITQQGNATLGSATTAVKVVDNKGTIKYLQAANGLTSFTNTTPNGGVITTWQLGGTLTSDTDVATGANEFKITLDAGGTFVLDGVTQETGIASDATTIDTSGWTLLVRDEATGEVKKLLADDIVSGIRTEYTQASDAAADVPITVTGLPTLTAATTAAKLFVYRNGVKLRFGTDFAVIADTVTITYSATDLPMYNGDIIEIQYIK